jgi:hypothetical protein
MMMNAMDDELVRGVGEVAGTDNHEEVKDWHQLNPNTLNPNTLHLKTLHPKTLNLKRCR